NPIAMAGYLFFDLPARNTPMEKFRADLEREGDKLSARFQSAGDTPRNHRSLTHIIGIEKWGQQRLKVALGEPFIDEEYDGYRPSQDTPWSDLADMFQQTRAETIALTEQLAAQPYDGKIRHNSFGELTVGGWLKYLNGHASGTALLIR
ncbi:MAG: DinB family protein, partial [Chloroflexota bacterium]